MIVVSDTSPVSYLHQLGYPRLLGDLFGRVTVPTAVARELRRAGSLHAELDWSLLEVRAPSDSTRVETLLEQLDRGEAEAIALALELHASLLLIDEATGRRIAEELGIRRTGLLGVILEAERRGRIRSAARVLDQLVTTTTFRVAEDVKQEFLRLAGESRSSNSRVPGPPDEAAPLPPDDASGT